MSPRLRYASTTVALLGVGLAWVLIQAPWQRPAPGLAAPPRAAAVRPAPPPPLPTAGEILDRQAALSLTAEQVTRLEALRRAWRDESADLEAAVEAAGEQFARFAAEARAAKGASVGEIQRRSAEFRELSAALRERRRLHGEAAAGVLTDTQRQTLGTSTSRDIQGGTR
jgi:hypothetical protein